MNSDDSTVPPPDLAALNYGITDDSPFAPQEQCISGAIAASTDTQVPSQPNTVAQQNSNQPDGSPKVKRGRGHNKSKMDKSTRRTKRVTFEGMNSSATGGGKRTRRGKSPGKQTTRNGDKTVVRQRRRTKKSSARQVLYGDATQASVIEQGIYENAKNARCATSEAMNKCGGPPEAIKVKSSIGRETLCNDAWHEVCKVHEVHEKEGENRINDTETRVADKWFTEWPRRKMERDLRKVERRKANAVQIKRKEYVESDVIKCGKALREAQSDGNNVGKDVEILLPPIYDLGRLEAGLGQPLLSCHSDSIDALYQAALKTRAACSKGARRVRAATGGVRAGADAGDISKRNAELVEEVYLLRCALVNSYGMSGSREEAKAGDRQQIASSKFPKVESLTAISLTRLATQLSRLGVIEGAKDFGARYALFDERESRYVRCMQDGLKYLRQHMSGSQVSEVALDTVSTIVGDVHVKLLRELVGRLGTGREEEHPQLTAAGNCVIEETREMYENMLSADGDIGFMWSRAVSQRLVKPLLAVAESGCESLAQRLKASLGEILKRIGASMSGGNQTFSSACEVSMSIALYVPDAVKLVDDEHVYSIGRYNVLFFEHAAKCRPFGENVGAARRGSLPVGYMPATC